MYGGYLYGLDDGNLECIDLTDGSRKWKDERFSGEGRDRDRRVSDRRIYARSV